VAKFVKACEAADLDALVALLTDGVFISMPPMAFSTRAEASWPASTPTPSKRAGGSPSCGRERTVYSRSVTAFPLPNPD